MRILENQTLYQCSYCSKRLLTKTGCMIHENEYCKNENSPHVKNCDHEFATAWRETINCPRGEPDYDYCIKCGHID